MRFTAVVVMVVVSGCGQSTTRDAVPQAANAPTSPPAPPDAGPGFACDLAIEARLDGEVFRGTPMTPAYADALGRQADRGARWNGRSHGVKYLRCTYRIRIAGAPYRYEHDGRTGTPMSADLDPALCDDAGYQAEVLAHVETVTRGCVELTGHEYWGTVFEPL
jgi:hypothetical protein